MSFQTGAAEKTFITERAHEGSPLVNLGMRDQVAVVPEGFSTLLAVVSVDAEVILKGKQVGEHLEAVRALVDADVVGFLVIKEASGVEVRAATLLAFVFAIVLVFVILERAVTRRIFFVVSILWWQNCRGRLRRSRRWLMRPLVMSKG